jgi:hypothetical protein
MVPFREKTYEMEVELLAKIRANLPVLEAKLKEFLSHDIYDNFLYRFYSQSFKVYYLQEVTQEIIVMLREIAPVGKTFCSYFQEIINAGASGTEFERSHNDNWTLHTRPIVEAFFHAKYFLEMAVKCGKEVSEPPSPMPYGYAALITLFDIWGYADLEARMIRG